MCYNHSADMLKLYGENSIWSIIVIDRKLVKQTHESESYIFNNSYIVRNNDNRLFAWNYRGKIKQA